MVIFRVFVLEFVMLLSFCYWCVIFVSFFLICVLVLLLVVFRIFLLVFCKDFIVGVCLVIIWVNSCDRKSGFY